MTFSSYALREGVLLDTLQRTRGGSVHHLRDVSRRSVRDVAATFDEEPEHSAQVAKIALELFDATSMLHGLDEGCREYLEAAALLANVGLFISHSQHHRHSYYVIRNSERLVGFTDTEIEIIAQVARYHRKSAPKPSHQEFAALRRPDQEVVRTLAGILRVAIGLDRSQDGRVTRLRARRRGQVLTIEADADGGADLSLELYAANERKDLLQEVLGLRVEVVATTRRDSGPDELFDQPRQLQGAVTLHAVAGTLHHHHLGGRLAAQQLGDVVVVDHGRQAAPNEQQRRPDGCHRVPQPCVVDGRDGPLAVWRRRGRLRHQPVVAVVAPRPGAVVELAGVVEDAPAQRRHRAGRVVLDGAGQQLVEAGEPLRAADEVDDRLGLLFRCTRGNVDHDEAAHEIGPRRGQHDGREAAE